jgi:hypothetical protein
VRPAELTTQTCKIATRGRSTGAEHVVTVWFVVIEGRFYAASRHGLRGDWMRNALQQGSLEVRSGRSSWSGPARVAEPDVVPAVIDTFAAKYRRYSEIIDAWRTEPPAFIEVDLG